MSWILRSLASWQGRLTSGAAFFIATAIASTSATSSTLSLQAKIMCALPLIPTGIAWVTASLSGINVSHPHDVQLFESIMLTIPSGERHFIRSHDFSNNFYREKLNGLREISYWDGATYKFLDNSLQKEWTNLKNQIDDLYSLISLTTAPKSGNVDMQTVYPKSVDPEDPPERVIEEINSLNTYSNKLIQSLDKFEIKARRKLFV